MSKSYTLSFPNINPDLQISLTSSKSISNRLLIMNALANNSLNIVNWASAKDTQTLKSILENKNSGLYDVGPAGTAMRFLTSFCSVTDGLNTTLTGSERMQQRPIKALVDALKQIGAEIEYTAEQGYPPMQIKGKTLLGGKVVIDGSLSSQYVSSLLLIAPYLELGLDLYPEGNITSKPYLEMTLALMQHFGINYKWNQNFIKILPGHYRNPDERTFVVEADWSAASYWYSLCSLSPIGSKIRLQGLQSQSLQGDSALIDIYESLGVESIFENETLILTNNGLIKPVLDYNFSSCPDIAQTVAVTMVGLGITGQLSGLHTLKIKETDRIQALVNEISKLGGKIIGGPDFIEIQSSEKLSPASIVTYEDHRMAMAFAPLAIKVPGLIIEEPEVVVKSYPEFWSDFAKAGLEVIGNR